MRKWYPIVLITATIIASVVVYPRLPDRVPTHWNMHGQVDGYGPKWMTTLLLPAVLVGIWGLMRLLPKIDPWRDNYAKMQDTYDVVVNAALTVIALAHFAVIAATLGMPIDAERVMPVGAGVLLIVIGNVLPRARPNFWFGIRTPWTLTNERVWERTHRVGGYLLVGAGILVVGSAFLPIDIAVPAAAVMAVGAALITVVYSYYAWRQETSR